MSVFCPICKEKTTWEENPHRPFCSERCRWIDLGSWADESYRIVSKIDESRSLAPETSPEEKSEQ